MLQSIAVNVKIFKALSLIEILISLFIASFLLISLIRLQADFYQQLRKQQELLFLQQETHQLLDYLQHHIQQINFQGKEREDSNSHLLTQDGKAYFLDNNKQCFIFFYDKNADGCIGERKNRNKCTLNGINNVKEMNKEVFGFKLYNQAIYYYAPNNKSYNSCLTSQCQKLVSDCQTGWKILTSQYKVEQFKFDWLEHNKLLQINIKIRSESNPSLFYEAESKIVLLNKRSM